MEEQQLHPVHATGDWVTLRHPLTGDVQEVEATPESLTPLMIQGYQKFTPANPAKGE